MFNKLKLAVGWVATVCGLALLWQGAYAANALMFKHLELSVYASLIFLPAALRVIYPLIFGSAGFFGVVVGSYVAFPASASTSIIDAVSLAILSGTAPLMGIGVFNLLFKTRPDLADLRPQHLFALAILCAAANAIVLNLYLALSGQLIKPLRQIGTIFLGDAFGMIILLYVTAVILTLFISRKTKSDRNISPVAATL